MSSVLADALDALGAASLVAPVVIPARDVDVDVSADDVLHTFRMAGDVYRQRKRRVGCTFAFDGRVQQSGLSELFPSFFDTTLDDYCSRLESFARGDFTTIMLGCQLYDPALWWRLRGLFADVRRVEGFREDRVDLDCFLGTYARTPTGIHRDEATNLSYVVAGRKTMLFWPADHFDSLPHGPTGHLGTDLNDVAAHEGSAMRIDAEAGQIICWPRSLWHISIDNVRPATFNIGLYPPPRRQALGAVATRVAAQIERRVGALLALVDDLALGVGEIQLPPWWQELDDALAAVVGPVTAVEAADEARVHLVRTASRCGFAELPEPREPAVLGPDSVVDATSAMGPAWLETSDGRLIVGAGGQAMVTSALGLRTALRLLASGGCRTITELAAVCVETDPTVTIDDLCRLLSVLHAWHGVEVVDAGDTAAGTDR